MKLGFIISSNRAAAMFLIDYFCPLGHKLQIVVPVKQSKGNQSCIPPADSIASFQLYLLSSFPARKSVKGQVAARMRGEIRMPAVVWSPRGSWLLTGELPRLA